MGSVCLLRQRAVAYLFLVRPMNSNRSVSDVPMQRLRKLRAIVLLLILAAPLYAQDSTRGKGLKDPLLDKLVGDWKVERKFGSGRTAENLVHAEWVLQHQ